jgi:hypothetical protein
MTVQVKKPYPAFKHGGSAIGLVPGESAADFEKHHQGLIAEFIPMGTFEEGIVLNLAQLLWRKKNLETSRIVGFVQRRRKQLLKEKLPFDVVNFTKADLANRVAPAEHEEAARAAEDQVRKEFGDKWAELGENASVDALMKDLAVHERLDAMIDKCLKRLLHVRGFKSISASSCSL